MLLLREENLENDVWRLNQATQAKETVVQGVSIMCKDMEYRKISVFREYPLV